MSQCSCCGWATGFPEILYGLALVVPGVLRLGAAGSEVNLSPILHCFCLEGDQRMSRLEVYQLPDGSPKSCPDKELRGWDLCIPSCSGGKERFSFSCFFFCNRL